MDFPDFPEPNYPGEHTITIILDTQSDSHAVKFTSSYQELREALEPALRNLFGSAFPEIERERMDKIIAMGQSLAP